MRDIRVGKRDRRTDPTKGGHLERMPMLVGLKYDSIRNLTEHKSLEMSLLFITVLLGSAVKTHTFDRIIGGEDCEPHSKPWQVALHYFSDFQCGGILIDEYWVLTAAHCNLPNIQITMGGHNLHDPEGTEQYTYAEKMCSHSCFNITTYDNDIMLLKLASPAVLTTFVQTLPLADQYVDVGTNCIASGWGTITSPEVNGQHYNRIIGGKECVANSQPWQCSLHYFDQHVCGGTLIDKSWVLTAAHCQLPSLQIRLGDHNLNVYEGKEQFTYAEKICPHKSFNPHTYDNDIMLLKLPSPVTLNAYVQTIPLGCPAVADGTNCLVSGWGTTTSPEETFPEVLQCVAISAVSQSVCQQSYATDDITDNMLCAGVMEGGKDSCQGDSGGPLVCDSKLHGITSWGNIPCAEQNKPGIYTKVCNYMNWIQETIVKGDCI
ncbi:trypsin-like [Rhinophrynus dorsalis]